ncbi:mtDNA inheritance, partitioning of the mitochondrial organelle, partial [Dipsacomyces acuminosporus]
EDAKQDVLESDFRHLAEECDHIQGFQVLADAFGGFSGYGTAFIARIRDEYPKSSIMLYSISNTTAKNTDGGYGMDTSISFAANLENVSMFVPLSTPLDILKLHPNVEIKESKFYQASALMALNVDTWSYSLLTRKRTLDEIVNQVTQQEYYTLAESLFAPGLQITSADSFSHFNDILERDFVSSTATSAAHDVGRMAGQLIVDRGAGISSLVSARYPAAAYARFDSPVRLSRAFPKIFRRINSQGFKTRLADHPEEEMRRELQSGLLCTASSSESYLQQLHEWLRSESSRHLKDYERDSIREYRYALDSTIDKYAGI